MKVRVLLSVVISLFSSIGRPSWGFRFEYGPPEEKMFDLYERSFGRKLDARGIVEGCLSSIRANEEGVKLLDRIGLLFELFEKVECLNLKIDSNVKVSFKKMGTSFGGGASQTNEKMRVLLNFDFTQSTAWHDRFELCSLVPAISRCDDDIYSIGIAADPYWYTVAHELVHMERWLQEKLNNAVAVFLYGDRLNELINEAVDRDPRIVELKSKGGEAGKVSEMREVVLGQLFSKRKLFDDVLRKGLLENLRKDLGSINERLDRLVKDLIQNNLMGRCDNAVDTISKLFSLTSTVDNGKYYTMKEDDIINYYVFLNDPKRWHVRYSKNLNINSWETIRRISSNFKKFPELFEKKTSLIFWKSLEEREAVVGSRCSELTLRLKDPANPPIRYLYQPRETVFVESADVLASILGRVDEQYRNKSSLEERLVTRVDPCYFSQRQIRRRINMD